MAKEDWAVVEVMAKDLPSAECILELRERVEALEAGLKIPPGAAGNGLDAKEPLSAANQWWARLTPAQRKDVQELTRAYWNAKVGG